MASLWLQDVEATVLQAAQANLVTAAAQRVIEACKASGLEPVKEVMRNGTKNRTE